jgi:iron complex outermembrane receptor protein
MVPSSLSKEIPMIPQLRACQAGRRFPLHAPRSAVAQLICLGVLMSVLPTSGHTAEPSGMPSAPLRNYDIAPGPLGTAINRFVVESGVLVSTTGVLTDGKQSNGVKGRYSAHEALTRLLAGTGLEPVADGNAMVIRAGAAGASSAPATLREIVVQTAADATPAALPKAFAGGQVAAGSRVGILGNVGVFDTPFSTQSFTEEFVRDQQSRRIADVIAVDPSVRSAQAEYGDTETYMIRGFPLFVNQVGINGLYGMTEARRITPEFYERVDVLKGPASMLYGMTPFGAVGGNINLVSKRAGDAPLARVTTSYVSDNQLGAHVDLGRRFGDNNEVGLRLNALTRDGDTPIERQTDRMNNAALALDYRGQRLKASLDVTQQKRRTGAQTANMSYNPGFALPAAPDNQHNFANDWESITTTAKYWMAQAEYEFDPALSAYASYGKGTGDEEYYYAASQMRRLINSAGDFTARAGGFRGSYDTDTYEVGLRGALKLGSVSSRYALSYSDLSRTARGSTINATGVYTGNIYRTPTVPAPTVRYGDIPQNADLRLSSLGLMNTLGFIDDTVLLTLGVRAQSMDNGTFSAGTKTGAYTADKVTPSGALLIKLARDYSLYGNYSEGLAQGAAAPNGTANQGEILPPFITRQAETGIKYDAGTFGMSAAVFQISQPSAFTNRANRFVADGEQRNRGLELATFGEPLRGMRLLGGITLIDAKQAKTLNGVNNGKNALGVPRVNLVVNAEYDLPQVRGLTLTGRVSAFSSAYADADNTQRISGWSTLVLGARYMTDIAGKVVILRGSVMNVADKSYWNSVSRGFITSGAPRTLLLSASVEF